ncbi:efflux transporter outer membrane subunit [Sphingobium subterraneum]|uniref:Multidrug efflux system outer membrane protein n=1 Tax=Sphingobium subterraneum TaxID=627688 RepID=A0A841J908_9SPHN|nr:efflux transporter outer membrane subunit [Sphingobium subterraneum]MBB6125028.1 multidrug efflux system outer membrane protein [Sphingobium subterraneum]
MNSIGKRIVRLALMGASLATNAANGRETKLPDIAIPAQFDSQSQSVTAPTPAAGWWHVFNDTQLDALITRVHANNTTIAQASARLAGARAKARLGTASQMPQIDLVASANYASGPLINEAGGSGNLFTDRATISWEADLLGRVAGERKAERFDAVAAEALLRDAHLLMEVETARAYFDVLYLQRACGEADKTITLLGEAADIVGRRAELGLVGKLVHDKAILDLSEARQVGASLAERRAAEFGYLSFLLGETQTPTIAVADLPSAPAIPAGLPSSVLTRRPDIAEAIARFKASDQRFHAAKQSWLPTLNLTASGGGASAKLVEILASSARNFGLGALFSLPIFDGGRRKAEVADRRAELDLAASQYHERVLLALREVNDGLGEVALKRSAVNLATEKLAVSETNLAYAANRSANGTLGRAGVLDAELALSTSRVEALIARREHLSASLSLIAALGGAW